MPRSELQSQLKLETSLFTKIITQAESEGHLQASRTQIWLTGHQPQLSQAQQTAVDRLLAEFARAPYATPSVKDSLTALNDNEELLAALLDTGQLKRLNADVLILPATYAEFVAWLTAHLSKHHTVSVAEVRDELQTSRKYVLALLEYTDSQTLTRREGEGRVLVKKPAF
jgi:selenocysteine-specific elongation factor